MLCFNVVECGGGSSDACFAPDSRKIRMRVYTYWSNVASPPASRMPFNSASACGIIVSKLMHTSIGGVLCVQPPGVQHTSCLMWPYIE
jgi:hypothetical protein